MVRVWWCAELPVEHGAILENGVRWIFQKLDDKNMKWSVIKRFLDEIARIHGQNEVFPFQKFEPQYLESALTESSETCWGAFWTCEKTSDMVVGVIGHEMRRLFCAIREWSMQPAKWACSICRCMFQDRLAKFHDDPTTAMHSNTSLFVSLPLSSM